VEAGPRRPNRDAEAFRDLSQWVPEVVMEHDDRSLFRSQQSERMLEFVPERHAPGHIRGRRGIDLERPNASHPAAFASRLGVTGVHDQSMEPGIEALRVAQGGQVAPGTDEGLLRHVLGAMRSRRMR